MQTAAERFSTIRKTGVETSYFEDIYHRVMLMSWSRFILWFCGFFFIFNLIFSIIYFVLPDGLSGTDGTLFQHFAFSVQTFSTVGFGIFAPKTTAAHVVEILESMASVIVTALFTGLAFAKFSRTTSKVIFSRHALITSFDGKPTLMVRLGNLRGNQIIEASIRLMALISVTTREGVFMRRQIELPLVRERTTFFALSWTVMHVIDEKSPFHGLTAADLIQRDIELAVSMVGHDETVSQNMYANCFYGPGEFRFDRHFADVIQVEGRKVTAIDYSKFDDLI